MPLRILLVFVAMLVPTLAYAKPACKLQSANPQDLPGAEFPNNLEAPFGRFQTALGHTVPYTSVVDRADIINSLDPGYIRVCGQKRGGGAIVELRTTSGASVARAIRPAQCIDLYGPHVFVRHTCEPGSACNAILMYSTNSCHANPKQPYLSGHFQQAVYAITENDLKNLKNKQARIELDQHSQPSQLYFGDSSKTIEFCTSTPPPRGYHLFASPNSDGSSPVKSIEITTQCTYASGQSVWVETRSPSNRITGYHRIVK